MPISYDYEFYASYCSLSEPQNPYKISPRIIVNVLNEPKTLGLG